MGWSFIFKYKKKNYIFFEKYIYQNKRGEIAVGEIKNDSIINIKTIIKKKFHLSYPFVFTYKNKIFLIPESHEKKGIQIYISKIFPYKWKFYSSGFKDKTMLDPTILFLNKKIWLFVNEMRENYYSANKILKIYELDSLKLKKYKSHKLNPIINHEYGGRNAGRIFKIKNNYYRPAQINEKYNYGKGLAVFQIKKLNNNKYHQKEIFKIYGDQLDSNYCGIHHLDILNNYLTTDICLKKFK